MNGYDFAASLQPTVMPGVGRRVAIPTAEASQRPFLSGTGAGVDFAKFTALNLGIGSMSVWDAGAAIIGLLGRPDIEQRMLETSDSVQDWLKSNMSAEGLDSVNKQFLDEWSKSAFTDPLAIYATLVQQVPNIATVLLPGGAVAKGVQATGAGIRAANIARAATYAGTSGALSGGQSAAEAVRGVRALPGATEEDVSRARRTAFAIAAPVGAIAGPIEATFLRGVAGTGAKQLAKETAQAGAFEYGQEALEQVGTETGRWAGGAEFRPSAIQEAGAAGLAMGAAASGVRSARDHGIETYRKVQAARAAEAAAVSAAPPVPPASSTPPPGAPPAGPDLSAMTRDARPPVEPDPATVRRLAKEAKAREVELKTLGSTVTAAARRRDSARNHLEQVRAHHQAIAPSQFGARFDRSYLRLKKAEETFNAATAEHDRLAKEYENLERRIQALGTPGLGLKGDPGTWQAGAAKIRDPNIPPLPGTAPLAPPVLETAAEVQARERNIASRTAATVAPGMNLEAAGLSPEEQARGTLTAEQWAAATQTPPSGPPEPGQAPGGPPPPTPPPSPPSPSGTPPVPGTGGSSRYIRQQEEFEKATPGPRVSGSGQYVGSGWSMAAAMRARRRNKQIVTEAADPNRPTNVAQTAEGVATAVSDVGQSVAPPAATKVDTRRRARVQAPIISPTTTGQPAAPTVSVPQTAPPQEQMATLPAPVPAQAQPAAPPSGPTVGPSGQPPTAEGPAGPGALETAQRQASSEQPSAPAPLEPTAPTESPVAAQDRADKAEGAAVRRAAVETRLESSLPPSPDSDPAPLIGVNSTFDETTRTYNVVRPDGSMVTKPFPLPASGTGGLATVNNFLGQVFARGLGRPVPVAATDLGALLFKAMRAGGVEVAAWRDIAGDLAATVPIGTQVQFAQLPDGVLGKYDLNSGLITIDPVQVPADWRLNVVLHEMAHAATIGLLNDTGPKGNAFRTKLAHLRDAQAQWYERGRSAEAAITAQSIRDMPVEEYAAHVFSDPQVRHNLRHLKFTGNISLWQRFLQHLGRMLFGDETVTRANLLDQVLDFQKFWTNDPKQLRQLNDAAMHVEDGPGAKITRELMWTSFPALARMISHPHGATLDAKVASFLGPRPSRIGSRTSQAVRRNWYQFYSVEMLNDRMGGYLTKMTGGLVGSGAPGAKVSVDAGSALGTYTGRNNAREWRTGELMASTTATFDRAEDFRIDHPEENQRLEQLEQDATLWRLDPLKPLSDPVHSQSRQAPAAAQRHRDLVARFNAMSPEAQAIYRERSANEDYLQEEARKTFEMAVVRQYYVQHNADGSARKNPDGTVDNRPVAEAETMAKAELATLATITDPAKRREVIKTKGYGAALRKVHDVWDNMVKTPYRRQERVGTHFVIAGDKRYTKMRMSKADYENAANPALVNLQTRHGSEKFDPATNSYEFDGRYYYVESAFSELEAREQAQKIASENWHGINANVTHRPVEDRTYGTITAGSGLAEAASMISKAVEGLTGASHDVVANNIMAYFADRSVNGSPLRSRVHRENVPGASRNSSIAQLRGHNLLASMLAQAEHSPYLAEAKDQMERNQKAAATAGDAGLATTLFNTRMALVDREAAHTRADQPNSLMVRAGRWGARYAAFAFLTNLSTITVNLLQPWHYGLAHLSGKFDPVAISGALAKASADVAGKAGASLGMQFRRGLRGKMPQTSSRDPYKAITAKITNPEELAMLAEMNRRGMLNAGEVNDIIRTFPEDPQGRRGKLHQLEDLSFIMVKQGEVFNRVVMALATYRLARNNGMLPAAALEETYTSVRQSQFNYSQHNKGAFFLNPNFAPFLVFRNFALHSYAFIFSRAYDALVQPLKGSRAHVSKADQQIAQRQLAAFAAMTFVMAGLKGGIPEPLWIAWSLFCRFALGQTDPEHVLREGVASVFGAENTSMVTKGPLSSWLGIDLASRTNLNSMFVPDDVVSAKDPQEFFKATIMAATGVPGKLALDMLGGATKAFGEDSAPDVLMGLAQASGIRFVANPVTALNWYTHGYTDSKGNPRLTPEQIGAIGMVMKAVGFNPTVVAETSAKSRATSRMEAMATESRGVLYDALYNAVRNADQRAIDQVQKDIEAYNAANPTEPITRSQLRSSIKQRRQEDINRLTYQVPIPNKRAALFEQRIRQMYATP